MVTIIGVIVIILIIVQVNALLETLELTNSARRKGHFALYNGLVLGHTKYNGVQRVYCNPFPSKQFYSSHQMDHVMIQPPGVDNGALVVSPVCKGFALFPCLVTNQHKATQGPKHLTVHLSQRWKYMTIQRTVIVIIVIILIIAFILFVIYYCNY